jgi:hypothetical protein
MLPYNSSYLNTSLTAMFCHLVMGLNCSNLQSSVKLSTRYSKGEPKLYSYLKYKQEISNVTLPSKV